MLTISTPADALPRFMAKVLSATPLDKIRIEKEGVPGNVIKGLSRQLGLPSQRFFAILGIPKATAEKKTALGEMIKGTGGLAAVGMVELLAQAQAMAQNSTAEEAMTFDSALWLGQWIERPLPALGGHKPADMIDSPTGLALVKRLLGSVESGSYQ